MEQKILEYLKTKYKPSAVILFGSRTLGYARESSDWDLFIFVNEKHEESSHFFEGAYLDLNFVVIQQYTDEFITSTFGNVVGSFGISDGYKILLDTNDIAKNCVEKILGLHARGRKLSTIQIKNRINFLERRILKMENSLLNANLFFYHLGYYFEKVIQYWFEVKHDKWTPAPKIALEVISREDPYFFGALNIMSSPVDTTTKLKYATVVFDEIKKSKKS